MKPLEIVKSLKGSGVNPAVKRIPSHEKNPPFVENFSLTDACISKISSDSSAGKLITKN